MFQIKNVGQEDLFLKNSKETTHKIEIWILDIINQLNGINLTKNIKDIKWKKKLIIKENILLKMENIKEKKNLSMTI